MEVNEVAGVTRSKEPKPRVKIWLGAQHHSHSVLYREHVPFCEIGVWVVHWGVPLGDAVELTVRVPCLIFEFRALVTADHGTWFSTEAYCDICLVCHQCL